MPLCSAESTPDSTVPTLEDVALQAGVSTATVSRCLNAPDRVSETTRSRVMQAVRALGYAPNFGARALAARRTNTFGAVIPTMDNAIFARGLQAFQEELRKSGVMLLVASSSYSPEQEEEQIRALIARGAEALLLIGHDRTAQAYDLLEKQQIPYVISWVHDRAVQRASIGFDNRFSMAQLTAEVLKLGHVRLGCITAHRVGNDRTRERYAGVCTAMRDAGLNPDDLMLEETTYSIDTGAEAFGRLMDRDNRPTAVICASDVLAAGAVREARARSLRVPEDVSVTGFDDMDIAQIVQPALTSVSVPHRDMGRLAALDLLHQRGERTAPAGVELPTAIAWRDSLGPVPKGGQG